MALTQEEIDKIHEEEQERAKARAMYSNDNTPVTTVKKKTSHATLAVIIIIVTVMIVSIVMGDVTPKSQGTPNVGVQTNSVLVNSVSTQPEDAAQYAYTVKQDEDNGVVRNVHVVTNEKPSNDAQIEELTRYIQTALHCNNGCNLSIYDDEQAYLLDEEYKNIDTPEAANTWLVNNYIYVADHLLSFKEFAYDYISTYPYKDSQYEELKSK